MKTTTPEEIYDKNFVNIISLSGGKDSTALLLRAIELHVEFEAVFADTGHEHEETYKYIDYLEKRLGIKIRRIKADLTQRVLNKKKTIETKWRKDGVDEEIIQSALDNLKPTGVPMLDLAIWKGGFPSRLRQFCTQELKVVPMIEQVYEPIWKSGKEIIVWQGIRRSESKARENAKEFEQLPDGYYAYRPLVEWTARDVFDMHDKHSVDPNPLYKLGMGRVGCMPCINTGKKEMFQIQMRFPEVIDRMEEWERIVSKVSKQGKATFFTIDKLQGDGIRERAKWSRTKWGGKEEDKEKILEMEEIPTCASIYGLCE